MAKKGEINKKREQKTADKAITKDQQKAINDAVKFINEKVYSLQTPIFDIGKYLLKHFYNDDPSLFQSKDPTKDTSLQHLVNHPDIEMSQTSLYNAINYAIRGGKLQDKKYAALTDSHKFLLCKFMDESEMLKYADLAIDKKLSVRDLRAALREKDAIPLPGRRKGILAGKSTLSVYQQIYEPVEFIEKLTLEDLDFGKLTAENITSLEDAIKKAKAKLDKFLGKIREAKKSES